MVRLQEGIGPLGFAAPHPLVVAARRAVGGLLAGASIVLGRLAQSVAAGDRSPASTAGDPEPAEFYAEAGAPEGALYLGGEFVGWIAGVKRL